MYVSYSLCILWFIIYECRLTNAAYIFGYMLHNPIPGDFASQTETKDDDKSDETLVGNSFVNDGTVNDTLIRCVDDVICKSVDKQLFCDKHYGICDIIRTETELCRRDEQCESGLICLFGKCEKPANSGHKGARCKSDSDCHPHLCCARQHGERICKAKLQRGQRCFVPLGGLDYSLNELCPCDDGLTCVQRKRKSDKRERFNLRSDLDNLRCKRIATTTQSTQSTQLT